MIWFLGSISSLFPQQKVIRVRKQGLWKKGEHYLPSPPVSWAGRREVLSQVHQSQGWRSGCAAWLGADRGLAGEGMSTPGLLISEDKVENFVS